MAKADQPVHCLRQNIYGEWTFILSAESQKVNLFEVKDVCTHNMPNGVQIVTSQHQFAFQNQKKIKVTLDDDYKAKAEIDGVMVKGRWSTIYDQAVKVELDNGQRFLANFRYNAKSDLTTDPLKDASQLMFANIHTSDYGSFDSDCSKTMVGFVQYSNDKSTMTEHSVQCFFAQ